MNIYISLSIVRQLCFVDVVILDFNHQILIPVLDKFAFKPLGTDHLTCRGGGMVFCFVQNFFFWTTRELEYFFFFCRDKREFFFPELNIRLYDKNSESDYFFFPPPKSEYFFQQHWESEYFFRNKTSNILRGTYLRD